jgi:allophanate hydrolase subunit 2
MKVAEVLRAGQRSLIVSAADERRCAFGLPPGGPFDSGCAELANRAIGNPADATIIECAAVGPELLFTEQSLLALCEGDGRVRQFAVAAGERVAIGRIRGGFRAMLALRGGFRSPAGEFDLEPPPIAAGQALHSAGLTAAQPRIPTADRPGSGTIRVLAGPHQAGDSTLDFAARVSWRVTPQIDRTAVRLAAPEADLPSLPGLLPSCGMQFGTVQWHPGGELVAMGPDHPVTGGYLQVMTVLTSERWKLAQLAPGDTVRWLIERP